MSPAIPQFDVLAMDEKAAITDPSAIIDNIPYVATMNPLVIDMAGSLWPEESGLALLQHPELMPLWWSLALGACLGATVRPSGPPPT